MKRIKRRSEKSGLVPGALVYIGEEISKETKITLIEYNNEKFIRKDLKGLIPELKEITPSLIRWINVEGIENIKIIKDVGNLFEFHPLLSEDILNTEQRPKLDDYKKYIAIFLRMLFWNEKCEEIEVELSTLVLSDTFLASFEEQERNIFDPIRKRIKESIGRIRQLNVDYLLYSLIDVVVDNYFKVQEKISEKIEDLENQILTEPSNNTFQAIHNLKSQVNKTIRSIWPLRDVINRIVREEFSLIKSDYIFYFRDIYDHIIQINDLLENNRDTLSSLVDLYLSIIGNKTNEIMKVLAIVSAIFIPLSFLAGALGMNFKYIPAVEFEWGFPLVIIIMVGIALLMLLYFKKIKWI